MKKLILLTLLLCLTVWGAVWYLKLESVKSSTPQIVVEEHSSAKAGMSASKKPEAVDNRDFGELPVLWEETDSVKSKLGEPEYTDDEPSDLYQALNRKEWKEKYKWYDRSVTIGYVPFYYYEGQYFFSNNMEPVGEEQKRVTSIDLYSIEETDVKSSNVANLVEHLVPADAKVKLKYRKVGERKNKTFLYTKTYDEQYIVYQSPSVEFDMLVEIKKEESDLADDPPSPELTIEASLITQNEYERILLHLNIDEDLAEVEKFEGWDVPKVREVPSAYIPAKDVTEETQPGSTSEGEDFRESQGLCKGYPNELLEEAIVSQNVDKVNACLENGADINADLRGSRPLMFAIGTGNPALVKHLLENGADPNLGSSYVLNYPLENTIKNYHEISNVDQIIKLLLKYGADPHLVSETGTTAISIAEEMGLEINW